MKKVLPCCREISDSIRYQSDCNVTVFVEVHSLASLNDICLLLGIRLLRDHFVHDDAVIIDFSDLVEVPQVVEADLAVHGEEEPVGLPTDPHVDVTQPTVHVDEHDVVVEYEQVHDEQTQMDDEGQEVAHEA
jgi:hypothetical protein